MANCQHLSGALMEGLHWRHVWRAGRDAALEVEAVSLPTPLRNGVVTNINHLTEMITGDHKLKVDFLKL